MIESIDVIGAGGRVGSTVSARLAERGVVLDEGDADLVLPLRPRPRSRGSRAASSQGRGSPTSAAEPLAALDPHVRRFGLHPLQSFSKARPGAARRGLGGGDRGDAGRCAPASGWPRRSACARSSSRRESQRVPRRRAMAANYLVALRGRRTVAVRGSRCAAGGARPAHPGSRRQRLRADWADRAWNWETVERHLDVIRSRRPELEELYLALAEPRRLASQGATHTRSRREGRRDDRGRPGGARAAALEQIGLVPTMGALHEGHVSLCAARTKCDAVVMSLFVNPQFGDDADFERYPRDGLATSGSLSSPAPTSSSRRRSKMYPPGFQTWVEVTELGSLLEGRFPSRPLPGGRDGRPQTAHDRPPDEDVLGQKDAQQVEVIRRLVADLCSRWRCAPSTVRDEDGLAASSRNVLLAGGARASAGTPARAGDEATRERQGLFSRVERPRRRLRRGRRLRSTVLAGAVRVGSTRLIDNVVLEGETER